MKAKTIPFPWRENAIGLALGLTIIALGAGLAHSQTGAAPTPATSAQQAAPPVSGFSCQAHPGGWCDLRAWRGFAEAYSQPEQK
jgi:hypothetical protein